MDLNRAAIFVRVVEDGGFSAAARTLKLPKSSVSRAVTLLEAELGARLLQRSTRQVTTTEAGSAFYQRAARGLAGLSDAAAAVADLQGALRGPIRITAPPDAGITLLEPAVSRFAKEHPGVQIEVLLTGRMVDLVEEGFDLALRFGELRDSALIARRLGTVDAALYAAPAYLEARGTPRRVADLAAHDCVLFRGVRQKATWTLTGPRGTEKVDVGGPVSADDFSFVQRAVQSGVGIGLLPSFTCRELLQAARLVRVLPRYRSPGAPMHLVYPSARYLPHRVAAFRDVLIATLPGIT